MGSYAFRSILLCLVRVIHCFPTIWALIQRHLDGNHFKANKDQLAQLMKPHQDQSEGWWDWRCYFVKVLASQRWSWNAILLNCWISWIWIEFCSLKAAWIIEDISLIRDSFSFISFDSIPLRHNRAAKEDEAIVQLEKCPCFLFSIVQHDFLK